MGVFFSVIHLVGVGVLPFMIHFSSMGVFQVMIHLRGVGVLSRMIHFRLMGVFLFMIPPVHIDSAYARPVARV